MNSETNTRPCRTRFRFGKCGRPKGHDGPHAVPVNDDVWYGRGGVSLGYGRLCGDDFESIGADR